MLAFLIIVLSIGIISLTILIINYNITKKVQNHSTRLHALNVLNNNTPFVNVNNSIEYHKHYDNKRNFNRIEPAYLMSADIRNNLTRVSTLCEKIKINQNLYNPYISNVNQLKSSVSQRECKDLKIPMFIYKAKEEKLFRENVLTPPLDVYYRVIMTYLSPQGQVNLKKEAEFHLNNILNCMESVSRSRLDRKTYEQLAFVERGEVSDSLRYNIMQRDGFKCVICGASASDGAHLHIDHIIPISKGGKSAPSNLRTLCERCNIGKSNKIEYK